MQAADVILIDDERDVLLSWGQTLELEGYRVVTSSSAEQALEQLTVRWPGIVLTDVKMPGLSGLNLLTRIRAIDPELPVVLFSGHGDISMAIAAIRDGAYDFVEKTAPPEYLLDVVRRALEKRRLILENRSLRSDLDDLAALEARLIGKTAAMEKLRDTVRNIADTNVDVLLDGETGSGKELVARCLHDYSARARSPFVALNCGAMPESIFESELFGCEPGAFTGASKRRIGKVEFAQGGTLFLDEVESLPLQLQVKLLRVLQERVVERLGGNRSIPVDVRVIAAAKEDLYDACRRKRFREDLLYRLNVVTVTLPPLRDRQADIPLLMAHFINAAAARHQRSAPDLEPELIGRLLCHSWPGNVRELKNVAERYVLGLANGHFAGGFTASPSAIPGGLAGQVEAFEKHLISTTLRTYQGRIGESAQALLVSRKTLYLRIRKFGLDKFDYR